VNHKPIDLLFSPTPGTPPTRPVGGTLYVESVQQQPMEVTFKFSADPNRCITISGLKRCSSPSSFEAAGVDMARRSLAENSDIDRSLSIDREPPTAVTVQDDVKTCGLERRQDARMTDPLHDVPLKALLQTLVEHHGW
jgi:hypothetical protein